MSRYEDRGRRPQGRSRPSDFLFEIVMGFYCWMFIQLALLDYPAGWINLASVCIVLFNTRRWVKKAR